MITSRTVKRFRSVAIALALTFATNYAISYAARSSNVLPMPEDTPRPTTQVHSSNVLPMPEDTPRP